MVAAQQDHVARPATPPSLPAGAYRDFFIGTTSVQGSLYHAGILFLNGAGFRGRVNIIIFFERDGIFP